MAGKVKKICWCVFFSAFMVSLCNAQSTYTFMGNFKNYTHKKQSITVHAQNGAVRLTYIRKIGFRVRYSFDDHFKPVFSYATLDSVLHKQRPKVVNKENRLILSADSMRVIIRKHPVRLSFINKAGKPYMQEDFGAGHQANKITHVIKKPDSTVYYGLGEKASALNRTGRTFTFWNSDTPGYRKNQDPLYKSFPFYIGLHSGKAYGVYYDNSFKSEFDFGGKLKNHVAFSAAGGALRYYVFYGPLMKEVLKKYTRLTGRAPLPPKWGLGYQQSRWSYTPEKKLYRLAEQFRSRQIPLDVLYLDIDYMNGYRVFTWDHNRFPTPQKMTSDLKKKGVKLVTIIDPGVKKDSTYFMFKQGKSNNYFVKLPDSNIYIGAVWPGKTAFPDFSKPSTRKWWQHSQKKLTDNGVAGIWNDMDEPAAFGGKTMPDIASFYKEGHKASALEMHNLYGLLMARTSFNGLKKVHPQKRPFVITRAAFSGVQRYSSVWTGDNSAKWDDVQLTMPMVMGLGLSGEPFAGFDIGGFNGSPDGEMYTRFLQIGIFMPFCRTHTVAGSRAQNPWAYGPRFTYINKSLIDLRYQMLPQLYTAFYEHTQTGLPIVRPLVMRYQQDKKTYNIDDQFLLGDHLMVAPVTHEGANSRKVYLPQGTWYRVFSDKMYTGNQTVRVDAPLQPLPRNVHNYHKALQGIPMFARAGAVLPMQKVQQYVGQTKIDTMQLNVYAGGSAVSQLYEDAGNGYNYKNGAYRLTTFKTTDSAEQLVIQLSHKGHFDDAAGTYQFAIHGISDKPKAILSNGKKINYHFDDDQKIVHFDSKADRSVIKIQK